MAQHSESEGEIVESDTEKATTALPSGHGTSVNRKLREALSPSPVPSPHSRSVSATSRDRSRSPYRASRSPRGEKRRRDDDHHGGRLQSDLRQFKAKYEDRSASYNSHNRYSHGQHHRSSRGDFGESSSRYDDRQVNRRHRRSRSPNGHKQRDSRHNRHDHRSRSRSPGNHSHRGEHDRHGHDKSRNVRVNEQSVNKRATGAPPYKSSSKQNTEHSVISSKQGNTTGPERDTLGGYIHQVQSHDQSHLAYNASSADVRDHHKSMNVETEPEPEPQDTAPETISIEERRKRREAIKAKYKGQANPMLAQALQLDSTPGTSPSQIGTPPTISDEPDSQPQSPTTPQHDSAQGSPPSFEVANDADLANAVQVLGTNESGDEPSAADYDPKMDMQEDRARNDTSEQAERPYVQDANHDDTLKQTPLTSESAGEGKQDSKTAKPKIEDDMFASDDEDDMFAPIAPTKAGVSEPESAKTVAKAKQLDMNLLDNWDDPAGYYRVILEELLDGRYHVQANLGKGMFSSVVRATDTETSRLVAIKIIRNNETMVKAGTKEMEILQKLADADPEDKKHVIRLVRSFTHKGHLCMVFENLSINLREVLKKFGRGVGINLKAVRSYAQQMFLGLSLLRKCNILHADLKPDNILVNDARNVLKICDLGSAADASENDITPYLVSRFYRAPEVILGMPYDFAIDMWSVGCTLFELYTGKILFTGPTNNQMLKSIMSCRGKISLKMLKKAEYGAVHFDDRNLNFRSMEREEATGKSVTRLINFVKPADGRDLKSRLLATATSGLGPGSKSLPQAELKEVNLFADLLDRCLALNPERRITPSEALKHPFIHRASATTGR